MIVESLKSLGITTEFIVNPDATTEEEYLTSYKDLTNQNRFFDWSIVSVKISELKAAEPLRLLRLERDKLLTASDWRMTKDYPYADQLDWEDYRFELRELPQRIANGEVPAPTLNENGMLVFDEWPLKPGETV